MCAHKRSLRVYSSQRKRVRTKSKEDGAVKKKTTQQTEMTKGMFLLY